MSNEADKSFLVKPPNGLKNKKWVKDDIEIKLLEEKGY